MMIDHPVYGTIPFTAAPDDVEHHGKELYAKALAGEFGEIAPYIEPPAVELTVEQIAELRRKAYQEQADPLFFKQMRGEATEQEWLAKIQEIKTRYPG